MQVGSDLSEGLGAYMSRGEILPYYKRNSLLADTFALAII